MSLVTAANDEVLLAFRKALHRKTIDPVADDDRFLVDFTEQFFVDQPDSGTIAERALERTHRQFLVLWAETDEACSP